MSPRRAQQCALCSYGGGGAGPGGMWESRRRGSSERARPGAPRSPSSPSPCPGERSKAAVWGRAGARGGGGAGGRRWPAVTAVSHDGCQRGLGHPRARAPPRASRRSQECEGWGCRLEGGCRASPPRSSPSGLNSQRPRLGGAGRRPRVPEDWVHETEPGARWRTGGGWMALTGPARRCQGIAWLPRELHWSFPQQTLEEITERGRRALFPRAEIPGCAELWGRFWVTKLLGSANVAWCKPLHCCP